MLKDDGTHAMALLLVIVSIALVVCLGLLIFGRSAPSTRAPVPGVVSAGAPAVRSGLDPELERKRREVEELKTTVAELRGELKQTRKKLHEQREGDKGGTDLVKARAEVERSASQQLEVVRSELAAALAEVGRLRSESEAFRTRAPRPPTAPTRRGRPRPGPGACSRGRRNLAASGSCRTPTARRWSASSTSPTASAPGPRSCRPRSAGSRAAPRRRPAVYTVAKGELDLLKDKFKALEKRLNRTLLERDLLRRAIRDLEKKSGLAADADRAHRGRGRGLGPLGGGAGRGRGSGDRPAHPTSRATERTERLEPQPPRPSHRPPVLSADGAAPVVLLGARWSPGRAAHGEGRLTATSTPGRPPRVSLATRIFLGHAVVLVTFGLLILFSVSELHRNQQEIRLVSQGYLLLAQDAAALDSFQRNQAQEAAQIAAETDPQTRAALARLAPLTFPPLPPGPTRIDRGDARLDAHHRTPLGADLPRLGAIAGRARVRRRRGARVLRRPGLVWLGGPGLPRRS